MSEINECIRTRRSIYPVQFSSRKVHKELIENLIENARWAPTHKLTQPWRFKVYYGNGAAKFGQDHAEMYKSRTAESDFKPVKYRKLKDNGERSSAVIAIIMKRDEKTKRSRRRGNRSRSGGSAKHVLNLQRVRLSCLLELERVHLHL